MSRATQLLEQAQGTVAEVQSKTDEARDPFGGDSRNIVKFLKSVIGKIEQAIKLTQQEEQTKAHDIVLAAFEDLDSKLDFI